VVLTPFHEDAAKIAATLCAVHSFLGKGFKNHDAYLFQHLEFSSLLKPSKFVGKKPKHYNFPVNPPAISTITSENQVKTYMDSSNGTRNPNARIYSKVRSSPF